MSLYLTSPPLAIDALCEELSDKVVAAMEQATDEPYLDDQDVSEAIVLIALSLATLAKRNERKP